VVPQGFCCLSRFLFLVIFGAFFWDFRGGVVEVFFAGFDVGVTHEDLVPLFLVTLPL
jgi:hypothetical protein